MANIFDSESPYIVNNNVGIGGQTTPTAKLHIGPSNGLSNSSPLKFNAGTSLSVPENGAMEFDGSHLYITISGIRYQIDQQSGGGGVAWGNIQGTLSNQIDLQNALNLKLNLTGGTLSGVLSLGGNKITNLATPTLSTDAATKGYVDSIPAAAVWGNITGTLSNQTDLESALNGKEPSITAGTTSQYWRGDKTFQNLTTSVVPEGSNQYFTAARVEAITLNSLAAPTGALSLNSQNITNLLDPTSAQMAATKNYVDGKFPVSVANGGTGVSSAFTAGSIIFSNGTTLFQDNAKLFWNDSTGTLAIGTNTPNSNSPFTSAGLEIDNNNGSNSDIVQRVANGYGTHFFAASNGTLAAPTVITSGNVLGAFEFLGYTGSSYAAATFIGIQASVGASFGAGSMPSDMAFQNALRKQVSTSNNSFIISSQKTIGMWAGPLAVTPAANLHIFQPNVNLPGVVQTAGTTTLVGTETLFTNDFKIGDTISVSGETSRIVAAITDNTHLTVTAAFSTSVSNLTYQSASRTVFAARGNGQVGIGTGFPSAVLTLSAGTANATTSPLKFTAGTNLTTPEAGAVEWDGTNLYITQTSGPTRQTLAYTGATVDSLTAGTGIFVSGSTGNVTVTNTGVTGLAGTANQVNVSSSAGAVILSLPQNINTGASPTFGGLSLGGQEVITANGSSSLTVGPNGLTNPVFNIDASVSSAATGLNVKGAAASSGLALSVISSGTNENLTIDAKGTGTIGVNTISSTSGLVTIGNSTSLSGLAVNGSVTSGVHTITSSSATALTVGPNGTTNPTINIDASTASAATGLNIKSAAAGGGLAIKIISSATNENLTIDAKGSGTITLSGVSTGQVILGSSTWTGGLNIQGTSGSALKVQIGSSAQVAFLVNASASSAATGITVTSAAAGSGIAVGTSSSGTNENLTINAKGSGTVGINTTSTTAGLVTLGNATSLAGVAINGTQTLTGKITSYNSIATSGQGVPSIYAYGRSTAQTAAVSSVAAYTNGAADGSFLISANVNVTTFSVGTFNVTVTYTDETNTSRTLTLNFSSITGTLGIAIAAAGAFEGLPVHIRSKASTSITVATSGTFTSLTYNCEAEITQIA